MAREHRLRWNRRCTLLLGGIPLAFLLSEPSPAFAEEPVNRIVWGTTQQGYPFMSGGVGIEERNRMMQDANQYDLELSFAAPSGDYLSDVRVVVNDQHGNEIINTITAGPLFYAKLPAGRYNVKAIFDNRTQEQNLQIDKGRRIARIFHWNVADQRIGRRDGNND